MTAKPSAHLPPGPPNDSWAGFYRDYSRDPLRYLTALQRQYGDIVALRAFNYRVFYLSHPDFIEQLLVTQARKFAKGRILKANRRLFGNGLLISEGDFWLRQRRLAQPAFHRVGHLRSTFVPIAPTSLHARLIAAGFWRVTVDYLGSAFRLRALRSWEE